MRGVAFVVVVAGCGRARFEERTFDASPFEHLALEAEGGQVLPDFGIVTDPAASGGQYVMDMASLGLTGHGAAIVTFEVGGAGTRPFHLWGRVLATDPAGDSFVFAIDSQPMQAFHTCVNGYSPTWQWVPLTPDHDGGMCLDSTALELALGPGPHTVVLSSREGGSSIDRMILTDDLAYVAAD